jgi:hypothetical protein
MLIIRTKCADKERHDSEIGGGELAGLPVLP